MGNHQVPAILQHVANVALNVLPWDFGREKITTPRIVPFCTKGFPDRP